MRIHRPSLGISPRRPMPAADRVPLVLGARVEAWFTSSMVTRPVHPIAVVPEGSMRGSAIVLVGDVADSLERS
jgi:hypothetical protein